MTSQFEEFENSTSRSTSNVVKSKITSIVGRYKKQALIISASIFAAFITIYITVKSYRSKPKDTSSDLEAQEIKEERDARQRQLELQWAREKEIEYEQEVVQRANDIQKKLQELAARMQSNLQEAEQNMEDFKVKFNSASVSYDDALTSIENEQDMQSSFMPPEQREKQKEAMMQIAELLKEDAELTRLEYNQLYGELHTTNQEYLRMYPDRPPLFIPPGQKN